MSSCSVCIVLEVCQYGSLSDVIRGGVSARSGFSVTRKVLPLSMSDRMFLALGCARGLHALHSYSANLCHRDVKSSNFLGMGAFSRDS
jgi:serine/threonine protein kinase